MDKAPEIDGFGKNFVVYRKRPEIVPANNRLSLERNVQQDTYKGFIASECDKQPGLNNLDQTTNFTAFPVYFNRFQHQRKG
ncbi:MAG TPA: hypothetical protein DEB39_02035 [Planctomycetaceae bacterium]|nr:hypothetical protein [Planctomycetaceae bacterium]